MASLDNLTPRYYTLQYDGTNGTEVFTAFHDYFSLAELSSDEEGVLTIDTHGPMGIVIFNTDDHLVFNAYGPQVFGRFTPTEVANLFVQVEV